MFIKHTVTKIPSEIKKMIFVGAIATLISSFLFNGMSFLLQLGKEQIVAGNIVIGLILITLYFVRSTLKSFFNLWNDTLRENFGEQMENLINNRIAGVLLKVRGKVWSKNDQTNSMEVMSTNSVLLSIRNYLTELWDFKTDLPFEIIKVVSIIAGVVGFTFVSISEIEHTFVFVAIVIFSSAFSMLFASKRVKTFRETRRKQRPVFTKRDELLNDILNIEPLNEEHSNYMVQNFIENNKLSFSYSKSSRLKIRTYEFLESFFGAISTVAIIGTKLWETGIANVNLETVLSIVAIMGIYNSIMDSVYQIIRDVEFTFRHINSIKLYKSDFGEILKVYDAIQNNFDIVKIDEVKVSEFSVQYQTTNGETPFSLVNTHNLTFTPGDTVLLVGPTGSGKSTFMKMLTNYIQFDSYMPVFKTSSVGTVGTVMHQTDGKLGCNSVLSELTLGKTVDEDKLLYILKNLHLFEEISEKDSNVINYLNHSKIHQFSSGQKQRLAIARLLYNLDDSISIIGFDEATNALNDAITLQTLQFVKEYCKDKILLVATHQVDIGSTVATKILEFSPEGTYYSLKAL